MSTSVDMDVCVSGSVVVRKIVRPEGSEAEITVPSDTVVFNRPRVNTDTTTLEYHKGAVGKVTDAAPWVSDTDPMIAAAYRYAQNIIATSDCTTSAWDSARRSITESLTDTIVKGDQKFDSISVKFEGAPDFDAVEIEDRSDISFDVGPVKCGQ